MEWYNSMQVIYTEHHTYKGKVQERQYNKGIVNNYKGTIVSIKEVCPTLLKYGIIKSVTV